MTIRNRRNDLGAAAFGQLPSAAFLALAWVVTIAVFAAGFAVLAFPLLLILFLLLAVVLEGCGVGSLSPSILRNPLVIAVAVFTVYAMVSALWSPVATVPLQKAGVLFLCLTTVTIAGSSIAASDALQLHRLARGLFVGLVVILAFMAIETLSGFAILNALLRHWPGRFTDRLEDGQIASFFLNRPVSAMALFIWPITLSTWYWLAPHRRRLAFGLIALLLAPVIVLTASQSAQAAFLLGAIGFAVAYYLPDRVRLIASGAWVFAFVAVIPAVKLLHALDLQHGTLLPHSFRARIAIWSATATQIGEHPFFGVGLRADRFMGLPRNGPANDTNDHLGWHAHDLFLQVWHELGVVGVMLSIFVGLMLIRQISSLPQPVRVFAYATFAATCGIAAFGYGAWQSWLLACYAWTVILLIIAGKVYHSALVAR